MMTVHSMQITALVLVLGGPGLVVAALLMERVMEKYQRQAKETRLNKLLGEKMLVDMLSEICGDLVTQGKPIYRIDLIVEGDIIHLDQYIGMIGLRRLDIKVDLELKKFGFSPWFSSRTIEVDTDLDKLESFLRSKLGFNDVRIVFDETSHDRQIAELRQELQTA